MKKENKKEDEDDERGPRIALEKVRRRELYHLLSVSIIVLFFVLVKFYFLGFGFLYCVSKKINRLK